VEKRVGRNLIISMMICLQQGTVAREQGVNRLEVSSFHEVFDLSYSNKPSFVVINELKYALGD
jgi:hypothetical protein